jgi:hypothetical protein
LISGVKGNLRTGIPNIRFLCTLEEKTMKLEQQRQKVASIPQFILRIGRFAFFSSMLIVISLFIGVLGYHNLGSLGWLDSFHMSSMILTGMGPVAEMKTNGAKLFSSLYALYSGVAFLTITAIFFTPIIHRILHILHLEPEDKNRETQKK